MLYVMEASRGEPDLAAHDASTIPQKRTAYWSGSESKSHRLRGVENEISVHVSLTFAMKEVEKCGATEVINSFYRAYVAERMGDRRSLH